MELDQMKALWQEYDKNLQANTITNERLMKHMLKERSHSKLNGFAIWEYVSLTVMGIVLLVFVSMWRTAGKELQVAVPYVINVLSLIAIVSWNIYKLRLLQSIDPYTDSVTGTKERAERFRLIITREKAWTMVLLPVQVCLLIPVIHYWVHGSYFSEYIGAYIPRVIAGCIVGLVLSYWIYTSLYVKNIKAILANLKEIEGLKKE